MKAIVYHGPEDIRVEELSKPSCGNDELLVKVDACAVCGTDLKTFKHGNPRIKPPMTMGHELTGLVEEVGAAAAGGFAVADRIVMATSISCGDCNYCKRGWPNLCANLAPMGFSYPGGMAEYVIIPGRALQNGHVVKTPSMEADHAALAEPVSCGVNSLSQTDLQKGDTVLVLGAGPLGIINACVARSLGAEKIILSEISDARLTQAKQFGFDVLINPSKEDLSECVKTHTDGLGADVAIVAAPAAKPQEDAMHLVRKRGSVVLFASLPASAATIQLDSRAIHYGELKVVGTSDSAPWHVEKAVELLESGQVPADKLVSHRLPLDEIHQAFELMASGEALRVVVKP
ncbi:alcohol dehydrogenase catalytic domain-containing protein [Novipirellula artificiosorum]|uniref:D-arabitol-phosphate dehydrogenase n=1 Tax=Novipirellula artificiosorum TaxID=2528016 RepID=A0A5C6DR68_9BACT|nr:alcohol dehydrogenase catalytic domain-containing protein [Novipirellula artificiosorum]TWU39773.1 D-arabitol-phosphate dehydrogenase [Novipirellula artificiosorum]